MRKSEKYRIMGILKRTLISLYCAVIACSVVYVLMFKYSPAQNALGALGSVCMDVVCMMICLVLVMSITFEFRKLKHSSKLFLCLMLGTMFGLFFDFLTWSFDGALTFNNWTYLAVSASLCSGSILAGVLIVYIATYMDDMYDMKASYISAQICLVLNGASFVMTAITAVTKTAFSLEGGHYTTGALYDYITIIPIATLLYMTGYVVAHYKQIGVHDVLAVIVYLFTMIVGTIIEASIGIGTTFVSVTVADVIIYVMLQNKMLESMENNLARERRNVQKWIIRSNTDELTGFYNRHAYEDEISAISSGEISDDFVYVSIDINGLKVVNDTLGHAAGDELIIGACDCMETCFGEYGKLFRTGGDEFAALIYVDENELEEIKFHLAEVTGAWRGTMVDSLAISCGYVLKKDADKLSLQQIAVLADKRMYEDKKLYYQDRGIDSRVYVNY